MIWTKGRVVALQERVGEAQRRIVELFQNGQITMSQGLKAWGQFLDSSRDNTQHGIYGTSAGVQVLTQDGLGAVVQNSADFLQDQFTDPLSEFSRKGDFSITYKLCYVAEAYDVTATDIDPSVAVMDALIARRIPKQGWGDFYSSADACDLYASILATAASLLALSRYTQFRASKECKEAVLWLAARATQDGDRRPHEMALAALALAEQKRLGPAIVGLDEAVAVLERKLSNWSAAAKKDGLDLSETHHFSIQFDGRRTNKYLFFIPHCLVALALLRLRSRSRVARRYVLTAVQYFAERILSASAFKPRTTQKVSSVDHLWIFRLLKEFADRPAVEMVPSRLLQWSAAPRWAQYALTLGTLALGVTAALSATLLTTNLLLRAVLGVVASIALSFFSRYAWEFFLKGRDK